jgi:hypothetical protein
MCIYVAQGTQISRFRDDLPLPMRGALIPENNRTRSVRLLCGGTLGQNQQLSFQFIDSSGLIRHHIAQFFAEPCRMRQLHFQLCYTVNIAHWIGLSSGLAQHRRRHDGAQQSLAKPGKTAKLCMNLF